VTGIDISQVAISKATVAARDMGLRNAHFYPMNAEEMTFDDEVFDLIFGSGIIHHLDVERAYRELHRTLKPDGRAVFVEPLGCNALINLYRKVTPGARTVDEHPLKPADFERAKRIFSSVDVRSYGLATLAAVPFRNTVIFKSIYSALKLLDDVILAPSALRYQGWFALIVAKKWQFCDAS